MLPTLSSEVIVQLDGKRDEGVEVRWLSSKRQRALKLLIQTLAENPQEQKLIPSGHHRQRPELHGVFCHRASLLMDGPKTVGGVARIIRLVKHPLELRLQLIK